MALGNSASRDGASGVPQTPRAWAAGAVRFLAELVALGVYGYWGWTAVPAVVPRAVGALGVPLVVAVVWGLVASPAAPYRLHRPWRTLLEVVVFGGAVTALFELGLPSLAAGFALLAAVAVGVALAFEGF